MGEIRITGIYDNTADRDDLIPGWGLSLLLTTLDHNILFDTGADLKILGHNLNRLKVDPEELDAIFLSHPHCDHIGGLSAVLRKNSDITVYITESFPDQLKRKIDGYGANQILISEPKEIFAGIWTTGEMKGVYKCTDLPEQSLILKTSKGTVLICGCSHPGITRIVERAREIIPEDPYLIIGGLHLGGKREEEILSVIKNLEDQSVNFVAPTHCTGKLALKLIEREFGERFVHFGVGEDISV